MSKKTELIGFRLSPEDKIIAEEVALSYGITVGALSGLLLDKFVKAQKKYGENLIYPPKFEYFTYSETSQTLKMSQSELKKQNKRTVVPRDKINYAKRNHNHSGGDGGDCFIFLQKKASQKYKYTPRKTLLSPAELSFMKALKLAVQTSFKLCVKSDFRM